MRSKAQMTPEDFRNITQGIQAVVFAIAALLGGFWALLRFGVTQEGARATLDLERIRAEAELLRGVSCELSIKHEVIEQKRFLVYVDVILVNHGKNIRVFRCDDFPFHINLVLVNNGEVYFREIVRLRINEASSDNETKFRWSVAVSLLPETPKRISFHYELDIPGTYLFSLLLESEDMEAKSTYDKRALERGKEIYAEHKDHPYYVPDKKSELKFGRYYYVGTPKDKSEL